MATAFASATALILAGWSAATGPAAGSPPPTIVTTTNAAPSAPAAPTGPHAVSISDFDFTPMTLTVPVGATVTWTNRDEEPHTIVAGDGSFHSPGMGTGATFAFTFTTAGSYDYVCSIHPFMHGTVTVTK